MYLMKPTRFCRFPLPCAAVLLMGTFVFGAHGAIFNFEGFSDGAQVSSQYSGGSAGVTFTGNLPVVLTSGISLNEFDFPPYSGVNVVTDESGPLSGNFSQPTTAFSAYFTYSLNAGDLLTLTAYSGPNQSGSILGTATSQSSANYSSSGSAVLPNEFLGITSSIPIYSFMITGESTGGSFVMDDFRVIVPEPEVVWGAALLGTWSLGRCIRRYSKSS